MADPTNRDRERARIIVRMVRSGMPPDTLVHSFAEAFAAAREQGAAETQRLIADDMEAIAKLYFAHGVDAAGEERRRTLMLAAKRIRTGEYLDGAAASGQGEGEKEEETTR